MVQRFLRMRFARGPIVLGAHLAVLRTAASVVDRRRAPFRLRIVMTIIADKGAGRRTRDGATAALRGVGVRLTGPRRLVLEVVRGAGCRARASAPCTGT